MVLSGVSKKLDQNDGEFSYRFGDIFVVFKESVDHWGANLGSVLVSSAFASAVSVLCGLVFVWRFYHRAAETAEANAEENSN